MNKYFALSTFYTFHLHITIYKEGFFTNAKTTDTFKEFPVSAPGSNYLGHRFVAQSVGMEYVGGFTFSAVRSLLGSVVLIPLILISGRKNSADTAATKANSFVGSSDGTVSSIRKRKDLIIGGISCGICLCLASNFQQFGIKYTTVGKAGFITACYIVIVPIIGLFLGKKCSKFIWAAVAMALIGLYLLCITDGFSIGKGDLLVLVCAFLFSIHILVIDHFSPKADGVNFPASSF